MFARATLLAISLAGLSQCTQFPDLDTAISPGAENAAYPELVPVEQLNAQIPETQTDPETVLSIEARVNNLRARADRLRRTVIDSPTRARMTAGVDQS